MILKKCFRFQPTLGHLLHTEAYSLNPMALRSHIIQIIASSSSNFISNWYPFSLQDH